MKFLQVTKIVKEIKFEEVWGELEAVTKMFPETITHRIYESGSGFQEK